MINSANEDVAVTHDSSLENPLVVAPSPGSIP